MGTNAYRPGGRRRDGEESTAASGSGGNTTATGTTVLQTEDGRGMHSKQKEQLRETLADMYREQCIQVGAGGRQAEGMTERRRNSSSGSSSSSSSSSSVEGGTCTYMCRFICS